MIEIPIIRNMLSPVESESLLQSEKGRDDSFSPGMQVVRIERQVEAIKERLER